MNSTQHLNREVEAAVAEKATPIWKGYWVNEFDSEIPMFICGEFWGPHPFKTLDHYISSEIAEMRGLRIIQASHPKMLERTGLRYLGPVFVPANTDNQGDGA